MHTTGYEATLHNEPSFLAFSSLPSLRACTVIDFPFRYSWSNRLADLAGKRSLLPILFYHAFQNVAQNFAFFIFLSQVTHAYILSLTIYFAFQSNTT